MCVKTTIEKRRATAAADIHNRQHGFCSLAPAAQQKEQTHRQSSSLSFLTTTNILTIYYHFLL